jgi:peptide/bleomycin uptake transporter
MSAWHNNAMFREFFCSGGVKSAGLAWGGVVAVVCHAMYGAWLKYRINGWYSGFYDLLQTAGPEQTLSGEDALSGAVANDGMQQVWHKLWEFAVLVLPMCVLHPLVKFLRAHWSFAWRLRLMQSYVKKWNPMHRPVEGAAQRVHEDTQRFASGLNGCIVVVLDSVFTLVVFIPILLDIGTRVVAPHWSRGLGDAWIVLLALWSALLGVVVAGIIGRKLIGLEVNNQRVEASLRRELVLLETAPVSVCCASSEDHAGGHTVMKSPSQAFHGLWSDLRDNYHRLFLNFMSLNAWLTVFEQYMTLVPYVAAAPLLFAPEPDTITLGTLVQLSNSFGKVFSSLNIVGDNWGAINEFVSCVVRLRQFERSVNLWIAVEHSTSTLASGSNGEEVLVARGAPRSHDADISSNSGGVELTSAPKLPPGCEPSHSDDEDDRV